jgi:sec-independent protein translocase protein TatA
MPRFLLQPPGANQPRPSPPRFLEFKMGNLGMMEILLIGVALLIFFGPSRLPDLGKSLGRSIQEFKKASRELTDSVKEDVAVPADKQ